MTHKWNTSTASRTTYYNTLCLSLLLGLTTVFPAAAEAQKESARSSRYAEENNQIRRDKFDLIVPKIMRDRERRFDHGLGPRMGSYGPDWTRDVPLAPNHHFVLEYFTYMPSPTDEGEYLIFYNHEQVIATENGVERLSQQQQELLLIR